MLDQKADRYGRCKCEETGTSGLFEKLEAEREATTRPFDSEYCC